MSTKEQLRVLKEGAVYLENCQYSESMFFRMKGLLGKNELADREGILLKPANQIHMFFMKFSIDAIFLDRENRIVHISHSIKPWRISPVVRKAVAVVEAPAGSALEFGLVTGHTLSFSRDNST